MLLPPHSYRLIDKKIRSFRITIIILIIIIIPFIILKGEKPRIHLKTLDSDLNMCYHQPRNWLKNGLTPFEVENMSGVVNRTIFYIIINFLCQTKIKH